MGFIRNMVVLALGVLAFKMIKRAMAWLGCDAGYVRRPLGNYIDKAAEEKLKEEFRAFRDANKITGVDFLNAI